MAVVAIYRIVLCAFGVVFGVVALWLLGLALMALFDAWEDWE